jgi:hypothetical protein
MIIEHLFRTETNQPAAEKRTATPADPAHNMVCCSPREQTATKRWCSVGKTQERNVFTLILLVSDYSLPHDMRMSRVI